MYGAVAHHALTDAQQVPEQWPPASFTPRLYILHGVICYGISLWPVGISCPGCVSSQLLVPPSLLTGGVG